MQIDGILVWRGSGAGNRVHFEQVVARLVLVCGNRAITCQLMIKISVFCDMV
jgi:hypothetical protein